MAIKIRLISFIWGFFEATFFFLVPDIWLSRIVIKSPKEAYINVAITTAGALAGGIIMYYMGTTMFEALFPFLDNVPAISKTMINDV